MVNRSVCLSVRFFHLRSYSVADFGKFNIGWFKLNIMVGGGGGWIDFCMYGSIITSDLQVIQTEIHQCFQKRSVMQTELVPDISMAPIILYNFYLKHFFR